MDGSTLEDDINLAEDYLKFCVQYVMDNNKSDLEFFEKRVAEPLKLGAFMYAHGTGWGPGFRVYADEIVPNGVCAAALCGRLRRRRGPPGGAV